MKNSLESLFGSKERWRIIKLFLLNEETLLSLKEVAERTKIDKKEARQILNQLVANKFILKRKRAKNISYEMNVKFPSFNELKFLVIKSNAYPQCEGLAKIEGLGNIKLAIVTGIFVNEPKSRTDLLLVGEGLPASKVERLISNLEAELGREINYSVMEFAEFKYRADMFDKFIMEIIEMPHQILINRIPNIITQLTIAKNK